MDINYYTTIKRAKEFGIPIADAIEERLKFLNVELEEEKEIYNELDKIIDIVFVGKQIRKTMNEISYLQRYKEPDKNDDSHVSKDRIELAKSVPIENIIEFVNGKAYAFCHEDKTPSLSKHPTKNYARCFVCNKTFGTIDAYMEIYNVSFLEAVRALT